MLKKAFIFAAGEGRRMLPLTENCPKPLLNVGDKCLLEYHIEKLVAAGIKNIVVNIAYLADMIVERIGDGRQYGANIQYSRESRPLETGGGLLHAMHLLDDKPFLLVNGDVWTDLPFSQLLGRKDCIALAEDAGAFLFLVNNPDHHPAGDFGFVGTTQCITQEAETRWTYSGISIISPGLISTFPQKREKFPLIEAFRYAIEHKKLFGEVYEGEWLDVGTEQRLNALRERLHKT